eukprot:scaffold57174_cov47-Phaeocystis_antarctica.AAC.1
MNWDSCINSIGYDQISTIRPKNTTRAKRYGPKVRPKVFNNSQPPLARGSAAPRGSSLCGPSRELASWAASLGRRAIRSRACGRRKRRAARSAGSGRSGSRAPRRSRSRGRRGSRRCRAAATAWSRGLGRAPATGFPAA